VASSLTRTACEELPPGFFEPRYRDAYNMVIHGQGPVLQSILELVAKIVARLPPDRREARAQIVCDIVTFHQRTWTWRERRPTFRDLVEAAVSARAARALPALRTLQRHWLERYYRPPPAGVAEPEEMAAGFVKRTASEWRAHFADSCSYFC
jgi:hypothetical protein